MGEQVIAIAIQKLGDFIAKTLSNYVTREVVLLNKVRSNAEWLHNELGYMLSFLQDAKEEGEDAEQAGKHAVFRRWKADVHKIAEDTTSVLQEITLKVNKDSKKGCLEVVQLYVCMRGNRAEIVDINEKIESLKVRVEEVSRKRETYGIRNSEPSPTQKNKEQVPEKLVELTPFPEKLASDSGQEYQGASDNLPHNGSTDAETSFPEKLASDPGQEYQGTSDNLPHNGSTDAETSFPEKLASDPGQEYQGTRDTLPLNGSTDAETSFPEKLASDPGQEYQGTSDSLPRNGSTDAETSFPEKLASDPGQEYQGKSDSLPHNDSTDGETSFPEKLASDPGQEYQGASDNLPHNGRTDAEHAQVSLPHNCEDILKHADSPVDRTSSDKLYEQLHAGVYLNGKKKKYWVKEESNINCFTLFARDLSVTWGHDERYWHWPVLTESSEESLTAAELIDVCWLEVHARLEMSNLTPETVYEVVFIVKLKNRAYGWVVPINLRLTLPDGTRHERRENLNEKPREEWIEISGGEFKTSSGKVGELEISFYECEVLNWKNGLFVKGVSFRPKAG